MSQPTKNHLSHLGTKMRQIGERCFPWVMHNAKSTTILLGCLFFLIPIVSDAAPLYQGQSVWKVSKSNGWYLVIAGTPSSSVEYVTPRTKRQYRYTGSDVCGFASLKLPISPFRDLEANGQLVDPNAVPLVNGTYNCSPSSEQANISTHSYNPQTRTFYFQAGWRTPVQFTWSQFDSGRTNLNRCGYLEVFFAGMNEGAVTVNGQAYDFATLTTAPHPLMCRTIEGTSVPYVPNGF